MPAIGALQGRLPQMCACGEGLRMHAPGPPSANLTFAEGLGCQLGRAAVHKVNMCGRGGVAAGGGPASGTLQSRLPSANFKFAEGGPGACHSQALTGGQSTPSRNVTSSACRPTSPAAIRPWATCHQTFSACCPTFVSLQSDFPASPWTMSNLQYDLGQLVIRPCPPAVRPCPPAVRPYQPATRPRAPDARLPTAPA